MRKTMMIILTLFVLAVIAGCGGTEADDDVNVITTPGPDEYAQCFTAKGATMYGAEWCGACNAQKGLFGEAFEHIDYVECPENQERCTADGITAYPTWIIDGKQHVGVQSLEMLATLTGCTGLI